MRIYTLERAKFTFSISELYCQKRNYRFNPMNISNHYATLRIERNATSEEIKSAFRRLAKQFHPDKNPGHENQAEQQFRLICVAYEALIDENKRRVYDDTLQQHDAQKRTRDIYKENLRRRARYQVEAQCQLILAELMSNNCCTAVRLYEHLLKEYSVDFDFTRYMSNADSRDCEFLLAEAYHTLGQYKQAASLYEQSIKRECEHPYFRSLVKDMKLRLKKLYSHSLARSAPAEEAIIYFQKILNLGLSKRDTAWAYKKLAEFYFESENIQLARENLEKAFQIYPNLTGAKKICHKLGMKYPHSTKYSF